MTTVINLHDRRTSKACTENEAAWETVRDNVEAALDYHGNTLCDTALISATINALFFTLKDRGASLDAIVEHATQTLRVLAKRKA